MIDEVKNSEGGKQTTWSERKKGRHHFGEEWLERENPQGFGERWVTRE